MAKPSVNVFCAVVTLMFLYGGSCERIRDKMYQSIAGASFCFKRLTAFEEYGCTSSQSGDTGVVHFIQDESDVTWLLDKASADPYVIVVTYEYFTREHLIKLRDSGKVSGIILNGNSTMNPVQYSPDDTCPNRDSGFPAEACDSSQKWNPFGRVLMNVNWGFPVIYVSSETSIDFLHKCFINHNAHDLDNQSKRTLCAVEITNHMLAAVDSRTCIRRSNLINNLQPTKFCDPLGDHSIYLPLFPRLPALEERSRSVILVTARMDGASLFDSKVPGAVTPIAAIVTLMTVAKHLHDMAKLVDRKDKNVVFFLLNGESFDYIGSSRLVYDMERGVFPFQTEDKSVRQSPPLQLDHVGLVVELDQLVHRTVFWHRMEGTNLSPLAAQFIEALGNETSKAKLSLNKGPGKLPPSSVQRFLRSDPAAEALVLASYNDSYTNTFYHSVLDDSHNLNYTYLNGSDAAPGDIQTVISELSLVLAKTLYGVLLNEEYTGPAKANATLVDELLHCYLDTLNCDLFRRATIDRVLPNRTSSLYVGVQGTNNTETMLTGLALAYLTGGETKANRSSCYNGTDSVYRYIWMRGDADNDTGVCIQTMVNYTLAESPAFEIEDYNWASNNYSSWTESIWRTMTARVFLKPARHHEILTLSLGLFILVLSFAVVYFINTKANVLFNSKVLGTGGC